MPNESRTIEAEFDFSSWKMRDYVKLMKVQADNTNAGDKIDNLMVLIIGAISKWNLKEKPSIEALEDLTMAEWAVLMNQFGEAVGKSFQS